MQDADSPMPDVDEPPNVGLALQGVREELARTNDLFRRRLLDDRDKRALYDELYRQLELSRAGLIREAIAPVARRVLLAVDRIGQQAGADDFLESVRMELLEIFLQYGLRDVECDGGFDPSQQEAIGQVYGGSSGEVAEIVKGGYWLGDILLRPAQVVLYDGSAASETDGTGLDY